MIFRNQLQVLWLNSTCMFQNAIIITCPWSYMKPCVCIRPSLIRTLSACSVTRPWYVRVLVEAESRPPRSPCQGYGQARRLKSNQHSFTSSTGGCGQRLKSQHIFASFTIICDNFDIISAKMCYFMNLDVRP